jgi:hypothetical protein
MVLISLKANTTSPMLVSQVVISFSFLIVRSVITWPNGVAPTLGIFLNLLSIHGHIVYIVYRPRNKEELFNLRHASARNVIERIFGVLKRRFRILLLAPEYSLQIQARIPAALCAIHNFISIHDPAEDTVDDIDDHNYDNPRLDHDHEASAADAAAADDDEPSLNRDRIAQAMWDDYLAIRQGIDSEDSDSGEEVDE